MHRRCRWIGGACGRGRARAARRALVSTPRIACTSSTLPPTCASCRRGSAGGVPTGRNEGGSAMKRRLGRGLLVILLAAITLFFPLLAAPHRIDQTHRE